MDPTELNERFGIAGALAFAAGPGGMPHARLTAGDSYAEVALHGGHVVHYGQLGAPPVLWVSREAIYAAGKALRGGIPVCWPWFGPHPTDPGRPAHGLARTRLWAVAGGERTSDGVRLLLTLRDDEATRALWPHPFALTLAVTLGPALDVALTMRNTGAAPFRCGGALHSYFTVADVTHARIMGLDGRGYFDQLSGGDEVQVGPVTIGAEVDRVYADDGPACVIEDPALGRRITVTKAGSRTTVVWNPWVEKALRLADFGDDEYHTMLCVETAMARHDSVTLAAAEEHTLRATIAVAPLASAP